MSTEPATPAALVTRPAMAALLVVGPTATVIAVAALTSDPNSTHFGAGPTWMYLVVALVAWSPLPFSLPAVLLERARDEALPGFRGLGRVVRAVRFLPHMVHLSPARAEFRASLSGFAVAAAGVVLFLT